VLRAMAACLAVGGRVEMPWPMAQPASDLQLRYGVSRARAYELLERHATRTGRRYVLDKKSLAAIDTALEPDRVRRALVAYRTRDKPQTSRAAAERWVRRYLERHPDEARVTAGRQMPVVRVGNAGTMSAEDTSRLLTEIERIEGADETLVTREHRGDSGA
jgi:hypothetical protein